MKKLETERLVLKQYTDNEKNCFLTLVTNEKVMKNVDAGVFSNEKAEALWQKLMKEFYPSGIETIYAVFARDDSRYVGHASIRPRPENAEDWEIGYILTTAEWGKGFATEIARKLLKSGFDKLGLNEVFATIDDDNFDSIKVAEKSGMSFARYEFDEQGRFSVYSVKKSEWFA